MNHSVLGAVLAAALLAAGCEKTPGPPAQKTAAAPSAPVDAPSLDELSDSPDAEAPMPDPRAPVEGEPPFEEVLARARKEGRPIFLDVYTDWCGPCRNLERNVFPHPAVKAQLQRYLFQRYDAEKGHGLAVAERFGIDTYPSMIALTPEGFEVEREFSQDPYLLAGHMDELFPIAGTPGPITAEAMAKHPGDPRLTFLGALVAQRTGAPPRQYRQLLTHAEELDPSGKAGVAPIAMQRRLRAEAPVLGEPDKAARLAEFISRFPQAPFAEEAVYGLAATPAGARPPLSELKPALLKTIQAVKARGNVWGLRRLSEALLVLGEPRVALVAAEAGFKLAPRDPDSADVLAEAQHQAGETRKAIQLMERTQATAPDAGRAQRLTRLRAGDPSLPEIERFFSPLD